MTLEEKFEQQPLRNISITKGSHVTLPFSPFPCNEGPVSKGNVNVLKEPPLASKKTKKGINEDDEQSFSSSSYDADDDLGLSDSAQVTPTDSDDKIDEIQEPQFFIRKIKKERRPMPRRAHSERILLPTRPQGSTTSPHLHKTPAYNKKNGHARTMLHQQQQQQQPQQQQQQINGPSSSSINIIPDNKRPLRRAVSEWGVGHLNHHHHYPRRKQLSDGVFLKPQTLSRHFDFDMTRTPREINQQNRDCFFQTTATATATTTENNMHVQPFLSPAQRTQSLRIQPTFYTAADKHSRSTSIFASPRQVNRHIVEYEQKAGRPRTYQQDSDALWRQSNDEQLNNNVVKTCTSTCDRSNTFTAVPSLPPMPDLNPVGPSKPPIYQSHTPIYRPRPTKQRSCSLGCIPEQDIKIPIHGSTQPQRNVSDRNILYHHAPPHALLTTMLETVDDDENNLFSERTPLLAQDHPFHLASTQPLSPSSASRSNSFKHQPSSSSIRRRRRSRQRMMRHQSVDMFMLDHLGQEQQLQNDAGDLPRDPQDKLCAKIFSFQIGLIVALGIWQWIHLTHANQALIAADTLLANDVHSVNYDNLVVLTLVSGAFASVMSGGMLLIMTIVYKNLIPTSLLLAIGLSFAWGVLGVEVVPGSYTPALGFVCCLICTGYSIVIWRRIPFASANLHAALTGVRSAPGLWLVAFVAQFLILLWSLWSAFTVLSLYDYLVPNPSQKNSIKVLFATTVLLLFIWAYLWTFQVLVHIVQVVVARVISKWWEHGGPGDDDNLSLTSPHPRSKKLTGNNDNNDDGDEQQNQANNETPTLNALRDAIENAAVKNFGAICYGSLFVLPVQACRQLLDQFRDSNSHTLHESASKVRQERSDEEKASINGDSSGEESDLWCCCPLFVPPFFRSYVGTPLVDSIRSLNNDFNPWGFSYVGMYRYGWLDASRKASELLLARGWATIANDDLIINVLLLVSLVIGGCTGCFGALLEDTDQFSIGESRQKTHIAFIVGIVVGTVMSHVVMSVVIASVNTVILCYAGRPLCFKTTHPDLSEEMNNSWSEVWPGSLL